MCLGVGLYMRNSSLSPAQPIRATLKSPMGSIAVDKGVLGVKHINCPGGPQAMHITLKKQN